MKTYSLSFNTKRQTWIAQVKQQDGSWRSKFLPKLFTKYQQLEAERWLINFLANNNWHARVAPSNLAACSIKLIADKWLELKDKDPHVAPNTFNGLKLALKNWILDSNLDHYSIQDLDIETQLTSNEIIAWIKSLKGKEATKLQQIYALKTLLNDAIINEWVSNNLANPMDKPAVKQLVSKLHGSKSEDKVITFLTSSHIKQLLSTKTSKIADMRRIRYLLAITTGARISELHALTFADVNHSQRTLRIERQIVKQGVAPILNYKELIKNCTKETIQAQPNAICKPPKKNSKRELPLHQLAVEALGYWQGKGWKQFVGREPRATDPIFPRSKISLKENQIAGAFLSGSHQAEQFREDLERVDVPTTSQGEELTFHALRHSFSHLLELAGAEDAKISVLLGHGAKSVLRTHYLGAQTEAYRALIDALDIGTSIALNGS